MWIMLHIDMVRTPPFALIRVAGTLQSAAEIETFLSALEFVPSDEDLVVDLSELTVLAAQCVFALGSRLLQRALWSEAVVVSSQSDVTLQLVLGEVDRVVPVVRGLQQAADVIRTRRGTAAVEVGR
jgi:hypothetical protein